MSIAIGSGWASIVMIKLWLLATIEAYPVPQRRATKLLIFNFLTGDAGFRYPTEMDLGEYAKKKATRFEVNAAFNHATLHFADGSYLQFEHTSRSNRWAQPSADETTAGEVCRSIGQFRLKSCSVTSSGMLFTTLPITALP